MASIINASSSGSGGIVQTADASGVLQLQTNGTVALNINTSQQIGFGTTSPSTWGTTLVVYNNQLTVTGGGYDGAFADSIFFGGNSEGTTYRNKISNSVSSVVTNQQMKFSVASGSSTFIDAMTLNGSGAVALSGGTKTANGTGITFPATQSASTDANTLDDYEEGTWTPQIKGSSSNPTVTYSVQSGYYTKIGNIVYASAYLSWSSISGGSGEFQVSMPFASSGDNSRGVGSVPYNTGVNFNQYGLCVHSNIGTGNCYFIKVDTQQKYSSYVQISDVVASGVFQVVVIYKV